MMMKRFAQKGSIPEIGEIWQPIGEKQQLFMVYLLDIERVRPFVPDRFKIIPVLPGKTLGYLFMGYFGPQSTLEYHEFIVAPALVKYKTQKGFFVSHMYVDNEQSMIGGHKMGLPKQMVDVSWEGKRRDRIIIKKDNVDLIHFDYSRCMVSVGFTGSASLLSIVGDDVFYCENRLHSKWSICKIQFQFPDNNFLYDDFSKMGLGKPFLSVSGSHMRGEMGVGQRFIT
ncbi:MAG: hypothetical protein C0403_06860 [Desulfobacterium sp.]|nr:hypothetical protein [Desulfobacterium sp.]